MQAYRSNTAMAINPIIIKLSFCGSVLVSANEVGGRVIVFFLYNCICLTVEQFYSVGHDSLKPASLQNMKYKHGMSCKSSLIVFDLGQIPLPQTFN